MRSIVFVGWLVGSFVGVRSCSMADGRRAGVQRAALRAPAGGGTLRVPPYVYMYDSYRGLLVPSWTVRTTNYSYRSWTFRVIDDSYLGLFVPPLDVGHSFYCDIH